MTKRTLTPITAAAVLALTLGCLHPTTAIHAAVPTLVGNGDDGSDLEGAKLLKDGPIVEARETAVKQARDLGLAGVRGLGNLIPELERSPLYLSEKDVTATLPSDAGQFHSDIRGMVYARTFAVPHSPTRFFPIAQGLNRDQLVALHIHEALHRALPESIREDERIVAEIALAIVSPEASRDRVESVLTRVLPPDTPPTRGTAAGSSTMQIPPPPGSVAAMPSALSYEYRAYSGHTDMGGTSQINGMHVLRSFLYPFGETGQALGLGIEAALIDQSTRSVMGPLTLSARMSLWSNRAFDVGAWANASLNMLSAEELKTSRFGRDTYSIGLSMRKDFKRGYVENLLGYTAPGEATRPIGNVDYRYEYGAIIQAMLRGGVRVGAFDLGAYADLNLAESYRFTGGAFEDADGNLGRFRLLSAGPEVSYRIDDFRITIFGRNVLSAPVNADFDKLGMLMGAGSGQRSLGIRASYVF